jgi:hypothetical protein
MEQARKRGLWRETGVEPTLKDAPELRKELQDIWQTAALKLIEGGAPAPGVFEAMLIVGLAGLVEVEGKLVSAQRLAHIARQLADQVAAETPTQTIN